MMVGEGEKEETVGIMIRKAKKTYGGGCFGDREVRALQGVNLDIHNGELLSLLGHNGAGKTTLMSILTGVLKLDSGIINVMGFNINNGMKRIRELIGVCPQFDILYEDLTAREHLELFSNLKVKRTEKEQDFQEILDNVGLGSVIDNEVSTYSGGMKRRLSMTISSLNDPKIILLDEPTTGMDPVSRRQIWDMIQKLKRDKIILLTTHAMEEADNLSDRIAIMVDGTVKCVGTGLQLKSQYGNGYRIDIIVKNISEIDWIINYIKAYLIPNVKVVDQSGANIVLAVKTTHLDQLNNYVRVMEDDSYTHKTTTSDDNNDNSEMEKQKKLRREIVDWGVSNSTLEEVFMAVTDKKVKKSFQQ